ncbi:mechanosensitive ion channel [Trichocoleus sp. FACHB-591]|uniref:mechanosensitive ion channel domain-containing protein n=1 Tax=Trichocoleus sp. FACHB-591 TaxID=2692872 RepID=UPI0016861934|nr:mechanosensitive ion channel domain-containing protein [Trichocoleus sp. FACHB-591]MBD2096770.1 mechanosensitive ion channel [Trichocoleus sp. FACHB-591]
MTAPKPTFCRLRSHDSRLQRAWQGWRRRLVWHDGRSRRVQRRWGWFWLGLLTCWLTLWLTFIPSSGLAQTSSSNRAAQSPVVLDGRVLFQVGNFGNFTALERAAIVNAALEQEVRSPQPAVIEVAEENQQTIIRSQPNDRTLLTVTERDVLQGTNPVSQGRFWSRLIEAAVRQGQLERGSAYFQQALVFSSVVLLGAIAIQLILWVGERFLVRQLARHLGHPASSLHPWEQPAKLLLHLALIGLQAGLWTAVAWYVTDLFPEARSWRYRLFNFLTVPVVSLGESNYSALQLLLLLAFTSGLWFAVSGLTRLFRFYVLARTGAEPRVQELLAVLTQYVMTFLGLIVLLQIWGLDVRSLAILASVLGVGIGFGVQNITNNFISGLIITLERPIQVGDLIKVNELLGTVKRIGARSTEISTFDQVTIIVPNSRFLESEVINWSHGDPVSRLKLAVGVAYGSDIEQVQAALLEAAKSHPEVLVKPQPEVWFQGFGDNSLNFELLVWTGEPKKQFRVKSDIYYRIEASLRRNEIEIPFPQRDLHVRSPELKQLLASLQPPSFPSWKPQRSISNGNKSSDRPIPTLPESPDGFAGATVTMLALDDSSHSDLEALITTMRGPKGLKIQDRRYRLNLYPACFTGAEAVEWFVQTQNCTREAAIQLGQSLIEQGVIHHVLDERPFEDGYVFYRFYADEENANAENADGENTDETDISDR